ncbi:hypothetical protein [Georgenia sunbinii]
MIFLPTTGRWGSGPTRTIIHGDVNSYPSGVSRPARRRFVRCLDVVS